MSGIVKVLIGGSPCTHWSISQKKSRETTASGIGWELFKNYLIAKQRFQPDLFLYENNASAAQLIKDQISYELQTDLQYINSALVSGQARNRFYGHNFGAVPMPEDRGIILRDILDADGAPLEKAYTLQTTKAGAAPDEANEPLRIGVIENNAKTPAFDSKQYRVYSPNGKSTTLCGEGGGLGAKTGLYACPPCDGDERKPIYEVRNGLVEISGQFVPVRLADGCYIIRKLTVSECCRLQTMPEDYCRAVSPTQAYRGLGNGWTAEVIIHLISHTLKGIPKNEEILVLSMYDGIGTGRYCLEKLGYRNIKYYAYEIDKYAMQIANSNFKDIIQCGDAFRVRERDWRMPI